MVLRAMLMAAVAAAGCASASAERVDYTGHAQVTAKVLESDVPAFEKYLDHEEDPNVQLWKRRHTGDEVEFHLLVSPEKHAQLKNLDIVTSWGVTEADIQPLIDLEARRYQRVANETWTMDTFFDVFRPYDDHATFLTNLVSGNPNLVDEWQLGETVEGAPIRGITISGEGVADQKPAIYIQAGVHCREWIAISSTIFLANELVQKYETDANIKQLLDSYTFYIVPLVNIDGYKFTWSGNRLWRKNRARNAGGTIGVDLNRNWGPAETWCTAGSSTNPSSDTYCGPSQASEPETQGSQAFIDGHDNIRAAVDMHTYGPLLLWPWQYTYDRLPTQDYNMFVELGRDQENAIRAVHGQTYRSIQGSDLYPHSGGLIDYSWSQHGIKAFTYEGRGRSFVVADSEIVPAGEEQVAGLLELVKNMVDSETSVASE